MAAKGAGVAESFVKDLRTIFGERLDAVVAYGDGKQAQTPTLVLVQSLAWPDLEACAGRTGTWHRRGCATPLVLTRHDFARSLDAFPIEYGAILHDHEVVYGRDPFEGLSIRGEDLRRACEVQVKSHLIHLREDYLEAGGRHAEVNGLVRDSAPAFVSLVRHLARLDGGPVGGTAELIDYCARRIHLDPRVVGDVIALSDTSAPASVDAVRIFPAYLAAVEQLADFVDRWRES